MSPLLGLSAIAPSQCNPRGSPKINDMRNESAQLCAWLAVNLNDAACYKQKGCEEGKELLQVCSGDGKYW